MHLSAALIAGFLLGGPASQVASRGVVLVAGGQAKARIVAEPQAGKVAAFAARELQAYLQKATGARLPIDSQGRDDSTAEIIVGGGPAAASAGIDVKGLPRDGFHIHAAGHRVFIAGRDDVALDLAK